MAPTMKLHHAFAVLLTWACSAPAAIGDDHAAAQPILCRGHYHSEAAAVAQLGDDFLLRQRLEGEFQGRSFGLDCLVQKSGDTLTVAVTAASGAGPAMG